MPGPRNLAELQLFLRDGGKKLKAAGRAANRANAQLLGSTVRTHITKDDLPLEALSDEWVAFKLRTGKHAQHLWYTGEYLANFNIVASGGDAFTVGTNRPVVSSTFNLPQYLESRFPVWRLSIDETRQDMAANYREAVAAELQGRKPRLKRR